MTVLHATVMSNDKFVCIGQPTDVSRFLDSIIF